MAEPAAAPSPAPIPAPSPSPAARRLCRVAGSLTLNMIGWILVRTARAPTCGCGRLTTHRNGAGAAILRRIPAQPRSLGCARAG